MNAKIRRCNAWRQGRETLTYAVVNICSLKKNIYICNLLACLFSVISALSTFCLRSIFMETCWQSKRRKAPFVVSHLSHYCGQFLCVSSLCSGHVNRSCTDWKSFTPRLRFVFEDGKENLYTTPMFNDVYGGNIPDSQTIGSQKLPQVSWYFLWITMSLNTAYSYWPCLSHHKGKSYVRSG